MTKLQVAPDELELVRQFVNSLDVERPEGDGLADGKRATDWARDNGIVGAPVTDEGARQLRDLREAIRRELLAHTGDGIKEETWARLAAELGDIQFKLGFGTAGAVELLPGSEAAAEAIRAQIAGRIYNAVRDGSWSRLKACRKDTCLFAFYDRSKNGSGAWCSMAVCGNRVKAQRRRAKQRRD